MILRGSSSLPITIWIKSAWTIIGFIKTFRKWQFDCHLWLFNICDSWWLTQLTSNKIKIKKCPRILQIWSQNFVWTDLSNNSVHSVSSTSFGILLLWTLALPVEIVIILLLIKYVINNWTDFKKWNSIFEFMSH